MNITTKHIIPGIGLAAVLMSALASVALKWVLLIAVIEACIVLAFDPYSILERRLAPVSKAMIITATALTLIGLYWLMWMSIPALLICLLVAGLLIGLAVRYNGQWVADYLFFASANVKQALVSMGDLPHLKAWEDTGKRECDTMLRHYLHLTPSPAELDSLYRSVYALGYVKAQSVADSEIDRWINKHTRLANQYKALEQATVSKAEYDDLAKYYNRTLSELAEWREDAERYSYLYEHKCKAFEQLEKEYAYALAEMEALEESLENIEDVETEDIVRLPSLDERIRNDRAEGMSYSQLADKYGKTKSQVQYICSKGVAV